jgi:hypothetical protein
VGEGADSGGNGKDGSVSEWNTFEFMDRAATVELLIAELLTDHPAGEHPALEAKLTALEEAAGALYQAAGTHHHTLTPAKPEQPDHFGDSNEMVAATVKRLEDTVTQLDKAAFEFDERLAKLEAATPAKVRVVAPMMILPGAYEGREPLLLKDLDARWRAALSAAGVEVKEASNGKA